MPKVALAGASTGLGQIILDGILDSQNSHGFDIVVLSRSPSPGMTNRGVDVRIVDYRSQTSLTAALKDVHTVLSLIGGFDADSTRDSQLALLAAAKGAGVKRFAPSEYAFSDNEGMDLYNGKEVVWNAVKSSGLEYTRFSCGIFMNTLGTGTPKREREALGGLRPWTFVINMKAGTADLPGDGDAKVTFIRTQDIGKFVAAALGLDKWEEEMGMVGETASYSEVVAMIEKITARKMLVKKNSVAELDGMIREDEGTRFYNQVRRKVAIGQGTVPPTLNRLFPGLKPWTIEEYLERYWRGVELGEPAWEKGNIIL